jgi:DNA polymerase-3 subunit delta
MAFTFIAGADEFLVQRKAEARWQEIASLLEDAEALEVIDGQAGNIDEVGKAIHGFTAAVQTLSMFAPVKGVWLKNVTFLGDSVTGRAKGTLELVEHLQSILESIDPATVHALISAAPVDRRKKAYKWLKANGDSVFLEGGTDLGSIAELAREEAASFGIQFVNGAADLFASKVGAHPRLALEEVRKLCTYVGAKGGEITGELVNNMVPASPDSDFFEAAGAFYSLDLRETLDAIHRHFFAGHDARPLLTSLQNRNRLLIQLKALTQSGHIRGRPSKANLAAAVQSFGSRFADPATKSSFNVFSQNPWYLGQLSEALSRLSLRQLMEFQSAFREAFLGIIRRPDDQESVLRAMAIQCLSQLSEGNRSHR